MPTDFPSASGLGYAPLGEILSGQREVLARITSGAPLRAVLDHIVQYAERCSPDLLGSILLYEPASGRLRRGGYGRLPASFGDAIDGLVPGPGAGSCGTAAYRGERVISEDVQEDPLWVEFRTFIAGYGIRSAWSSPLRSPTDGSLLGVFGMYYPRVGRPDATDLAFVDHFTHLAALAVDVHRREARLRESEQARHAALRALVAGFAHELNTPLGVARGAAELLCEADGGTSGGPLGLVQVNLDRAVKLVGAFRSAIVNQVPAPPHPTDIAANVGQAIYAAGPLFASRNLRIGVRADPLPAIPTLPVRLGEVVSNLLSNAALHAYGPEGGPADVYIGPVPQIPTHVCVVIRDTGRGMGPDEAARCTQPFFTTARGRGSTGLGLFLARHITESELGGQLLLETAPGEGTRWTLLLPRTGPAVRDAKGGAA